MTINIFDNQNLFSQTQVNNIQKASSRWPFEISISTNDYPSKAALENSLHNCVSNPNKICIGLDKQHHFISVHFGTATNVKTSDFNIISAAGNSEFKQGNFDDGVISILDRALESSKSSTAIIVQPVKEPVNYAPLYWGLGIGAVILAGFGFWIYRTNKKNNKIFTDVNDTISDFKSEASEFRSRNIEEQTWHDKFKSSVNTKPASSTGYYYQPAPRSETVIVNNSNNNSALDMMIGYEIGRSIEESHHHEHSQSSVVPSYSSNDWSSNSSSDSGGSSSDWSSGSSWDSGSSFDGGGGSSDW